MRRYPAFVPPIAPDEIVALARARAGGPPGLSEPPSAPATVVLLATDWPADLARALNGVRAHAPAGTQVVVVADAPSRGQAAALEALERGAGDPDEVVWTSARLGQAAALNAGVRRASGAVVILLDTSVEPSGDVVTPLIAAMADPSVAVAGGWGVATHDLRHFQEAGPGDGAAVGGSCLACPPAPGGHPAPPHAAPRAPRLDERPGRRTRPAEPAQLLSHHRPLRLAQRPGRGPLLDAGGRPEDEAATDHPQQPPDAPAAHQQRR